MLFLHWTRQFTIFSFSFSEPNCIECEDFLANTRMIIHKSLNRHLLLQEKEVQNKWTEVQWEKSRSHDKSRDARDRARDRERLAKEQYRLYGDKTPGLRGILKNGGEISRASTNSEKSRPVTANVKGRS